MQPFDQNQTSQDPTSVVAQSDPGAAPSKPVSPPPQKPKKKLRAYWPWLLAFLVLAAAVTSGAIIATNRDDNTNTATAASTSIAPAASIDTPSETGASSAVSTQTTDTVGVSTPLLDASAVGDAVIPSVVTVQIRGSVLGGGETLLGSGSGVIYDTAGHIVTNNHVAAAGTSYEVVLSDGRVYPADVVGTDPTTDLAVLEVSAGDLQPVTLGSTSDLAVGDPSVAIGSPLGLKGGPSLTVGVLSAFGREVQTDSTTYLEGMLQTDAPITQGSSGGALVDAQGRLIGITTAVGVSSVGIEGIGFATPVEIVKRVADEIIATGSASNPYLGIRGETALADTSDGGTKTVGVRIQSVEPGLAADEAGLVTDDVISAINGEPVRTMEGLVSLLRRYGAGTEIQVSLDSGKTLSVLLGQRPDGA
jgi:putative serine protease PepD